MKSKETCPDCGSDNLVYEGQLCSKVYLKCKSHVPRTSRTNYVVYCEDCFHHLPQKQQMRIDVSLFEASEGGRAKESVRRAAPDLLEECQVMLALLDREPEDAIFPCSAMRDSLRRVIAKATE